MEQIINTLTAMQNKPHCDLETGEVYGCEKGSKEWLHEQGHIKFNKLPSTSALIMWQGIAHLLWMISLTLAIFNKWMMFIALPMLIIYVGVDIYEEIWCNQYASYFYKKTYIVALKGLNSKRKII